MSGKLIRSGVLFRRYVSGVCFGGMLQKGSGGLSCGGVTALVDHGLQKVCFNLEILEKIDRCIVLVS